MPSLLLPEMFVLLGIDVFLAISLLTCLLDKHFPTAVPYLYQMAAIVGFGHLLVSKGFMSLFGEHMRFWYSIIYLVVALANVIAVNLYLGVSRKLWSLAKILFGGFTFPISLMFSFFIFGYVTLTTPSSLFPEVPMGLLCAVLVGCTFVLGIGVFVSIRPEMVRNRLEKRR